MIIALEGGICNGKTTLAKEMAKQISKINTATTARLYNFFYNQQLSRLFFRYSYQSSCFCSSKN